MIFIPLPFVVSLLLLILLVRMIIEKGTAVAIRPFLLLAVGYALLSALNGLRWGYGIKGLLPFMAILATTLPPLAWLCFRSLTGQRIFTRNQLIHALPTLLTILLIFIQPMMIDWFLVAMFLIYGAALLMLAARGEDALSGVILDHSRNVHIALITAGLSLISSALVDAFIAIDFINANGIHSASVVSAANILGLLILGTVAVVAGRSQPTEVTEEEILPLPLSPSFEDLTVTETIVKLVDEKKLYLDPELTLNRLSRKAVIPARRISEAINRTQKKSVSQFINSFRVSEACRLLKQNQASITTIMFESGFQTKSNFNREFLRQTGISPIEWRRNMIATNVLN